MRHSAQGLVGVLIDCVVLLALRRAAVVPGVQALWADASGHGLTGSLAIAQSVASFFRMWAMEGPDHIRIKKDPRGVSLFGQCCGTAWERWQPYIAPVFGVGAWGSTWSGGVGNRIDTEVARMLLARVSVHRREGQVWLDWHLRRHRWARNRIEGNGRMHMERRMI